MEQVYTIIAPCSLVDVETCQHVHLLTGQAVGEMSPEELSPAPAFACSFDNCSIWHRVYTISLQTLTCWNERCFPNCKEQRLTIETQKKGKISNNMQALYSFQFIAIASLYVARGTN